MDILQISLATLIVVSVRGSLDQAGYEFEFAVNPFDAFLKSLANTFQETIKNEKMKTILRFKIELFFKSNQARSPHKRAQYSSFFRPLSDGNFKRD